MNSEVINDYLSTQSMDSIKDINRIGLEVGAFAGKSKTFYIGLKEG